MGFEPCHCGLGIDPFAKQFIVSQLQQDEGGYQRIGGHSADGDFGPDSTGLLEIGEVDQPALDGISAAVLQGEGANAKRGDGDIAPAAIGFLEGDQALDEPGAEVGMGLVEFIKADEGQRGGRCGMGLMQLRQGGGFDAGADQIPKNLLIFSSVP